MGLRDICIGKAMEHICLKSGNVRGMRTGPAALAAAFVLALAGADHAAAAGVHILDVTGGAGCGSTTCFNDRGGYTLTFSAAKFGGPVDVSRLLLDRSVLGDLSGRFFSVSFQLGGQQLGSWGNWNMGQVGGDQFSLWGPDMTWNPGDGDLVIVLQLVAPDGDPVDINGVSLDGGGGGGGGFFGGDAPFGGHFGSGAQLIDGTDLPNDPPVTGGDWSDGLPPLDITDNIAAPEPSVWALMIGGMGLAGAVLRRRRSDPDAPRLAR
jgi:hypothetical protein